MAEYSSSWTIHGLSFLCGGTVPEKFIWALSIMSVLSFAIYMIQGFVRRFLWFEFRTEIRYEENPAIVLPQMIFCLSSAMMKVSTCFSDKLNIGGVSCDLGDAKLTYSKSSVDKNITATYLGNGCHTINETLSLTGAQNWMDIYFTLPISAKEAESNYTFQVNPVTPKGRPMDNSGININETFEDRTDEKSKEEINTTSEKESNQFSEHLAIGFLSQDEFQSRKEKFLFIRDDTVMLQPGEYTIYISKTHITRLGHPFSSNCTDQQVTPNPLSRRYSRPSCYQQCLIKNMLKRCGALPDIFQRFYTRNENITRKFGAVRTDCFRRLTFSFNQTACDCPLSCDDIEYKTRVQKGKGDTSSTTWRLHIMNGESKVTFIAQVADYTVGDMLSDIGGILGLTVGASSLSIVELCIFFVLSILKKIY